MDQNPDRWLQQLRTTIIITTLVLTGFGLLAIYSASNVTAFLRYGDPFFFAKKQAAVALLGFILIVAIDRMSLAWIRHLALPSLLLASVLLIACLVPPFAHKVNGASRWLKVLGFSFQPAELAKLALLLFLARNLSRKNLDIACFRTGILPNLAALSILVIPLMLQPDFGSAFLLSMVTIMLLFAAGLPRRYLVYATCLALPGIAYLIYKAPYRLARLMSFLDPWAEARGGGFQIIQSYLGFQNGGLFGVGLGESKQKLFFLPEAHTDFILSVIGEELGLFGVLIVIAAFALIVGAGIKIALAQKGLFYKYLAFGITTLIAVQAFLNLGVVMGMLPTKGIPLPFVSNGSTCLIIFLLAIAILARIAKVASDRGDCGGVS